MRLTQPVPDLVSLDLLQSVAEFGSIRQAAVAIGISQPAASMRLRSLERTLGLELLDRSSGRAKLTPAGLAVVQWSDRILDDLRSLLASAAALRNGGRTQLRIAASMTVAEYLIPAWLDGLRATDPEVAVSLQMGNSEQVAEIVKRRQVDLGFVEGPSSVPGLESCVIEPDDLVVVVARSHPWAKHRHPLSPQMLAGTPLVLREEGSGTREVLETALALFDLTVTPAVELGSTTAIKAAVGSGTGPAVLSRLATKADVQNGRLIEVVVEGLDLGRSIRAVWVRDSSLPKAAKRFLDQIRDGPSLLPQSDANRKS